MLNTPAPSSISVRSELRFKMSLEKERAHVVPTEHAEHRKRVVSRCDHSCSHPVICCQGCRLDKRVESSGTDSCAARKFTPLVERAQRIDLDPISA